MGKGGSSQTVGYRYFLGMHAILCHARADCLVKLTMGEKTLWEGVNFGGTIGVAKNNLFGGNKKEGGFIATIDVENGADDQTPNTYLASKLTAPVPAFRGVWALVFRQAYVGTSPYVKRWQALMRNCYNTYFKWRPAVAALNAEYELNGVAVYFSIDTSGSMIGDRIEAAKDAVLAVMDGAGSFTNVSVRVQTWASATVAQYTNYDYTTADRSALVAFLDGLATPSGATSFEAGVSTAPAFFTTADEQNPGASQVFSSNFETATSTIENPNNSLRKVVVFLSDGEDNNPSTGPAAARATLDTITGVETFCVAITEDSGTNLNPINSNGGLQVPAYGQGGTDGVAQLEILDNTPSDNVPVIDDGDVSSLQSLLQGGFSSFADINPVHILIDLLCDPELGGTGDLDSCGSTFDTAATTLAAEGLGLSFAWENTDNRADFKKNIERHIDGQVYYDQTTGRYEIKLIRPDFTVGELFTFDSSTIIEWTEVGDRPQPYDLPNQVTVVYTRRSDGEDESITVQNSAGVLTAGRIIPEKITYEGVTLPSLAKRLANRDLAALSTPAASGAIKVAYVPAGLNLGSAFIINEPRMKYNNTVCRVTEIEEGDGRENYVLIRFKEDVFAVDVATPLTADEFDPEVIVIEDTGLPVSGLQFATEVPYWVLVQDAGQTDVDVELTADPDAGYYVGGVTRPVSTVSHTGSTQIISDEGSPVAWTDVAYPNLLEAWTLTADLSADPSVTTFTVTETGIEDEVEVEDVIQIDDELMAVQSIAIADGIATFTVKRAVMDTVPRPHGLGSIAFLWVEDAAGDAVTYTSGESVTLRHLTQTSAEIQAVSDVDDITVTFAARAYSPYPVGNLMIDSQYVVSGVQSGTMTATWAHRDRTIQTTTSLTPYTDGNIGPETGVGYTPVVYEFDQHVDVFAFTDIFAQDDFFLNYTPSSTAEEAISPDDVLTHDFDLDTSPAPDLPTLRRGLGVITRKGTSPVYENHQTPYILVEHLLPPVDLEISGGLTGGGSSSGSGSPSPSPAD